MPKAGPSQATVQGVSKKHGVMASPYQWPQRRERRSQAKTNKMFLAERLFELFELLDKHDLRLSAHEMCFDPDIGESIRAIVRRKLRPTLNIVCCSIAFLEPSAPGSWKRETSKDFVILNETNDMINEKADAVFGSPADYDDTDLCHQQPVPG